MSEVRVSFEAVSTNDRFEKAAQAVENLARIMARLRGPGGCPWDREQTLDSLKTYLLEETYETLDAIDTGDPKLHREELGDLLLQIVFQSEIASESSGFGLAEVADGIAAKLVRRHPHVFADGDAKTAADVTKSWERIKAEERAAEAAAGGTSKSKPKGTLGGIPRALPALVRALRTGEKAAGVGFDWQSSGDVMAKVREEWEELAEAVATREAGRLGKNVGEKTPDAPAGHSSENASRDQAHVVEELGDLLFSIANLARHLDVDPEDALRQTLDKFQRRFGHLEERLEKDGKTPSEATIDELERLWEDAKLFDRR